MNKKGDADSDEIGSWALNLIVFFIIVAVAWLLFTRAEAIGDFFRSFWR